MRQNTDFLLVDLGQVERLRQLAIDIYSQHYTDLWDDGGRSYIADAFSMRRLEDELKNSAIRYYYVAQGDDLVGFIKIVLPADEHMEAGLYLERLYLDARTTGQGLGKQCLAFAESEARRTGFGRIWLQAMVYRDDVCRFYRKHGFTECGHRSLTASGVVSGREAMVVFEKMLP